MTFWDNPQMVINHIRHSCVTSDDTGMCEMVIVQDEPDIWQSKQRKRLGMFHTEDSTDFGDYSQSFDIAVSPGVMGRTPKTGRFDKTRKRQEYHCKNIHWDDNKTEKLTQAEIDELFQEKELNVEETEITIKVSKLSQLLQDSLNQPSNPFIDYAKFDGEGLEDTCPTRDICIFLTFLPTEEERLQPINITYVDTACVQDTIGLILYKYVLEGRKPKAQSDLKAYSLHIAEEDGEADMDFPALDDKELMSKFEFHYLALVEKHKVNRAPVKNSVSVKISIPQNGYSVVKVDRTDVKMKVVLAKFLKKRGIKKNGREYFLEKQGEEGHHIDMETTLESTGTLTFNLVRDSGARKPDEKELQTKTSTAQAEIMSLQYKSYRVLLVHRLLASTEVSLGIHGQKIEIDPVAQPKSQKFFTLLDFTRNKPVSLAVNNIADCEITEEKPGRAVFRIYYKKSEDFKHYEFEASPQIANEILRKIHNILKSRPQAVRTEFLTAKKRTYEKAKRR
ncbi:target of rapamycin complex 2 subunit MAPKAP1-like [Hydractinia symbiolongicarpus]|uniref:target of rapamycin complex 2 subunit MAPKAP1-like n=1 Tax=Hydractinia symbiolongicarpus TaxID=13093 RepID=UPI00254D6B3E|nr:target of rapamycin complex 2 subunit MAPKAP1-like [Hydractinia symbiolongicarpus]